MAWKDKMQSGLQECWRSAQLWCTLISSAIIISEQPGQSLRLAGVLAQCAALTHLNLFGNQIGTAGAESFAGVLAQCPALAHLNLGGNRIGDAGAESF